MRGRSHLEGLGARWKNNIKTDLREIGRGGGGVEWVGMGQGREHFRDNANKIMEDRGQ
jgi:hypothetical protein